ncbi:15335_t:CDS:1, partial [Funneliformis geosporum]
GSKGLLEFFIKIPKALGQFWVRTGIFEFVLITRQNLTYKKPKISNIFKSPLNPLSTSRQLSDFSCLIKLEPLYYHIVLILLCQKGHKTEYL